MFALYQFYVGILSIVLPCLIFFSSGVLQENRMMNQSMMKQLFS